MLKLKWMHINKGSPGSHCGNAIANLCVWIWECSVNANYTCVDWHSPVIKPLQHDWDHLQHSNINDTDACESYQFIVCNLIVSLWQCTKRNSDHSDSDHWCQPSKYKRNSHQFLDWCCNQSKRKTPPVRVHSILHVFQFDEIISNTLLLSLTYCVSQTLHSRNVARN